MVAIYIRPDADTVDGTWVNESASATNLYASIDESTFSDTDYIRSSDNPVGDVVKLRLSNFASAIVEPMKVRYRLKKNGPEPLNLIVRLVQGNSPGTVIAEWTEEDVSTTYSTEEQTLTTGQFSSITDLTDLYLEFEATTNIPTALDLLTGETQGFSIDARSVVTAEAAYIGGPYGGTVAVIDTGTPANDLSDVALDKSNLIQSGTSPKIVNWNTFAGPHNLLPYSQDFSTGGWADGDGGTTDNTSVAPDGTTTADTYTQGATSSLAQDIALSTNTQYTFSVYLKAGTATWIRLTMYGDTLGNEGQGWFNIATATVGSVANGGLASGTAISAVSVGSGWYRVSLTSTPTTTDISGSGVDITCVTADAGSTRDNTATVLVWGAQLNIGSLTTYVPTTAVVSGGVRWTPHNIYTFSEDSTNAVWDIAGTTRTADQTASPDGNVTADLITATAGNAVHVLYRDSTVSAPANVTMTRSLYVKFGTASFAMVTLSANTATDQWCVVVINSSGTITETTNGASATLSGSSITAIGNGWYRVTISGSFAETTHSGAVQIVNSGTPTHANRGDVTWTAAGTETIYVWGHQLNRGPIATPYLVTTSAARIGIPQGYDVAASKYGILVEPAATNLCIQSQELGNAAWTPFTATVTTDATTAPDGSLTAEKLVETAVNTEHRLATTTAFTMVSGDTYTASVFVKAAERTAVQIGLSNNTGSNFFDAAFDLSAGSIIGTEDIGAASVTDATITAVGNGWYRITVTGFATTTGTGLVVLWLLNSTYNSGYLGVAGSGVYFWGAQSETGSVATSYIPTVAASATRAVDNVRVSPLTSIPFSTTAATVYADFKTLIASNAAAPNIWEIAEGPGDTDRYNVFQNTTTAVVEDRVADTNQWNTNNNFGTLSATRSQITTAFATNDFDGSMDGGALFSDSSGTHVAITAANSDLLLGGYIGDGASMLNGYIYRFIWVPRQVQTASGNLSTWRFDYP